MAITHTRTPSDGINRRECGAYLDDAATPALATITLGFTPKRFRWLNATDRIEWEYSHGMADGTTLKTVAAGTRTLDTADVAIDVDDQVVTIAAAVIAQNKQYYWIAEA